MKIAILAATVAIMAFLIYRYSCEDHYSVGFDNDYLSLTKINKDIFLSGFHAGKELTESVKTFDAWSSGLEAIVFKGPDSRGHFNKIYSGRGKITQICSHEASKTLYALNLVYDGNSYISHLLLSNSAGREWKEITTPASNIVGIRLAADNVLYAWSNNQIYFLGKTWNEVKGKFNLLADTPAAFAAGAKGSLYFINSKREVLRVVYGKLERMTVTADGEIIGIALDPETEQPLIFIKHNTDSIEVVSGSSSIAKLPYITVNVVCSEGKNVVVVGADVKSDKPFRTYFISRDGGRKWRMSKTNLLNQVGPYALDKNDNLYTYIEGGVFASIKLRCL
jgi:hypothetical protein